MAFFISLIAEIAGTRKHRNSSESMLFFILFVLATLEAGLYADKDHCC